MQLHRRVGMVRLWRRGAVNGARMVVRPSQRTGERLLRPGSLATNKEWLGQVERATTCWRGAGKFRSNDSATTRHFSSYDLPAGGRRDQRSRGLPSRQGRGTQRASWPRRVRTPSQPSIGPAYARAASGAAGVRRGSCILGSRRPAESWESGRAAWQGLSGRTAGTSAGSDTTPQGGARPDDARAARSTPAPRRGLSLSTPAGRQSQ